MVGKTMVKLSSSASAAAIPLSTEKILSIGGLWRVELGEVRVGLRRLEAEELGRRLLCEARKLSSTSPSVLLSLLEGRVLLAVDLGEKCECKGLVIVLLLSARLLAADALSVFVAVS